MFKGFGCLTIWLLGFYEKYYYVLLHSAIYILASFVIMWFKQDYYLEISKIALRYKGSHIDYTYFDMIMYCMVNMMTSS